MSKSVLAQRTVLEDRPRIRLRLPLGDVLERLHPQGAFPLVEDPRTSRRALILGMMVLRPALQPWNPESLERNAAAAIGGVSKWCYDVAGLGGSWPISGGNGVDAFRLALQYGTVDAVMAGAATIAREGSRVAAGGGHLWQPYAPLSWPSLREQRALLEPAIEELRRERQREGLLSCRRYPAQIAITRGLGGEAELGRLLSARIFHDRHPDGSLIEAWILTSEAGEEALRRSARQRDLGLEDRFLVCSPQGHPEQIDLQRVPQLLRERLDARLVEHDGGAVSLQAFLEAGAVAQLHLTLMRGRSVRQVLEGTARLGALEREEALANLGARARFFPPGGGPLPAHWALVQLVTESHPSGEAVMACLDVRSRDAAS